MSEEMRIMKKAILTVIILLLISPAADACVGKVLHIGVIDSSEGRVFAELISILINERTGTTIQARFYKNSRELYEAVKMKDVDILVENTTRALSVLNRPAEPDAARAYEFVKTNYEKEKGLIWLKPFGFTNGSGGGPSYTATLLRNEILNNFPALPRVINKLGSVINDETYTKMMKSVDSGERPNKVAKDFLKSRKLI